MTVMTGKNFINVPTIFDFYFLDNRDDDNFLTFYFVITYPLL